jgi:hypothetical protein
MIEPPHEIPSTTGLITIAPTTHADHSADTPLQASVTCTPMFFKRIFLFCNRCRASTAGFYTAFSTSKKLL